MTTDETAKRLEEVRKHCLKCGDETSRHLGWLLDLLANRDARIAKLTAALLEIASMPSKPDGDIGYLWAAVECAHDALDLP